MFQFYCFNAYFLDTNVTIFSNYFENLFLLYTNLICKNMSFISINIYLTWSRIKERFFILRLMNDE